MGVDELYELFEYGFPSPAVAAMPAVYTATGEPFGELTCDPDGPLVAEVVRTTSDQFVGRLSLVRVFSGTLRPDTPLHVSGPSPALRGPPDRRPRRSRRRRRAGRTHVRAVRRRDAAEAVAIAGELVLVSKLTTAETSDTLSGTARPALIEPWLLPEPLLPVAIRATTRGEEEKLASALQRLVAEDVTLRLTHNAETHQIVLWTMGPAHVDKLLTALKDGWHVQVETEPVQTSFRETFVQPTVAQGRLVKQSGGHGQYAVCRLEIEPLERGAGIEFLDRVVGGAVPRHFIPSVEKGVRLQLEKGVLAGYPVVDVRITLVDGKAHSVDSSDMAFQTAGAHGAARGRQCVDGRPARTDRRRRHHRRRRLGRLDPGRPPGPPRAGPRHRDVRAGRPHRHPRRGARRWSCPGTPSICVRSPMEPARSPAPSFATTSCRRRSLVS